MGAALSRGMGWNSGYQIIAVLQVALTIAIFLSLPLWKNRAAEQSGSESSGQPLKMTQIFAIPGAKEILVAFFCYCALEQTAALWASSYLVINIGLDEKTAASMASLFFLGITAGRAVSGFLTYWLNDSNMIRLGQGIALLGIVVMLLPFGKMGAMVGLLLIGLGCAPIYPCVIHSTPEHFGEENSQALIGVQMASAYIGLLVMPPLFGVIANHLHVSLMPAYLAVIAAVMILMCERLNRKNKK